jgi:hypothetical protein
MITNMGLYGVLNAVERVTVLVDVLFIVDKYVLVDVFIFLLSFICKVDS